MQLGNPPFGDAEHLGDFFLGQFLVVVEGDDLGLLFRQAFQAGGDFPGQFLGFELFQGALAFLVLQGVLKAATVPFMVEGLLQADQPQMVHLAQQLMIIGQAQPQFPGHLVFFRRPAEAVFQQGEGFRHAPLLVPKGPGKPPHLAGFVDNRAAHPLLGEGFELHPLGGVETPGRVHQPDHGGAGHVVPGHVGRHLADHPLDDEIDDRQMLADQGFPIQRHLGGAGIDEGIQIHGYSPCPKERRRRQKSCWVPLAWTFWIIAVKLSAKSSKELLILLFGYSSTITFCREIDSRIRLS